jgi:hypothetical protein
MPLIRFTFPTPRTRNAQREQVYGILPRHCVFPGSLNMADQSVRRLWFSTGYYSCMINV